VTSDEIENWWRTAITQIEPGVIRLRGYAIENLIGRVGFAAMVWLLLRGDLPTAEQSRLLEAALVAAVDHGPQAPSIAIARMAATCGVGINNAIASATNALGDVHGGAGQQCMELYLEIERAAANQSIQAAAAEILATRLADPRRMLPGFGHRFHPIDPRAPRLMAMVEQARIAGAVSGSFATIGRAVEEDLAQRKGRRLPMNIDGATAVVFCELGFAPELGRALFVLARSVGIMAHAWEQIQQGGRIKGPMPPSVAVRYDGPPPRALPAGQR